MSDFQEFLYLRTDDLSSLRWALTHPNNFRWATDDGSPSIGDFQPNPDPRIWYLAVWRGADWMGDLIFQPANAVTYEGHLCLLPVARGSACRIVRGAFHWMFQHSPARRITASVAAYNRLAVAMCDREMQRVGVQRKSFLKNGQLHDQILFGVSPEDL